MSASKDLSRELMKASSPRANSYALSTVVLPELFFPTRQTTLSSDIFTGFSPMQPIFFIVKLKSLERLDADILCSIIDKRY